LIEFGKAFEALKTDITQSRAFNDRIEILFYYSGHADENGLLLAGTHFPYEKIRQEMALLKADVNVAVLDACASGAITRRKGVIRQPAFLSNSPADMKGYAFLTSSSENETAQESDRIKASFFTYYLISALRGAADSNADGKVSLNEAYEFSYNETLGRTAKTRGGPQHPAYDIQMSGTGELMLTDVRSISSILVLPEDLTGRIYIMNAERQLVAELFKPQGRSIDLGMESGSYSVYIDSGDIFLAASIKLAGKQTVVLEKRLFTVTQKEPSTVRGPSVYVVEKPPLPPVKSLEVAGHFSSFYSNMGYSIPRIEYPGIGGRFTFNLNNQIALEAETNFVKSTGEQRFINVFGAKAGLRKEGWGLFGLLRPGVITYREITGCFAVVGRPCDPHYAGTNRFGIDFGGAFEIYNFGVYKSDRLFFRLDITDTLASHTTQSWSYVPDQPPVLHERFLANHSPRFTIGAGFRF